MLWRKNLHDEEADPAHTQRSRKERLAAMRVDRTLAGMSQQLEEHPNRITEWGSGEGGAAAVFGGTPQLTRENVLFAQQGACAKR